MVNTTTPELAERIVTGWVTGAPVEGWEDPAGPLFASSRFAEYEITMAGGLTGCSTCTGTTPIQCC